MLLLEVLHVSIAVHALGLHTIIQESVLPFAFQHTLLQACFLHLVENFSVLGAKQPSKKDQF